MLARRGKGRGSERDRGQKSQFYLGSSGEVVTDQPLKRFTTQVWRMGQ